MLRYSQNTILRRLLLLSCLLYWVAATEKKDNDGVYLSHICLNPETCSPQGGAPIILLHGLTDIKETWDGIYQYLHRLTGRTVCIYDARNHGDSSWNETFSVDALVEDLGHFMDMMKMERAVIVGHSMGGRTAMRFAVKHPSRVERCFIEDMGLTTIPGRAVEMINMRIKGLFVSLSSIPDNANEVEAKAAVLNFIQKVLGVPVPEYFAKYLPLAFRDGTWQWKSNFKVMSKMLEDIRTFFPELRSGFYEGKAFFLHGTDSIYKVGDQKEEIQKIFPQAEFFSVEGAGHIIHPTYPEFFQELIKFLK